MIYTQDLYYLNESDFIIYDRHGESVINSKGLEYTEYMLYGDKHFVRVECSCTLLNTHKRNRYLARATIISVFVKINSLPCA